MRTGLDGQSTAPAVIADSASAANGATTCAGRAGGISITPDVTGNLGHARELLHRAFIAHDRVAFLGTGKAALRADRQTFDVDITRALLDPCDEVLAELELGDLGRYETEHGDLVVRYHCERFKGASALGIVFEEEELDSESPKQLCRYNIVATRRLPMTHTVAPA